MSIIFHKNTKEFHIFNSKISYIIKVLENGQLGHLYFGKKINDKDDFSYMLCERACICSPCTFKGNLNFSLETLKQEYPSYGTGDYRSPAFKIRTTLGDRISDFIYKTHNIFNGKKSIDGLPATYADKEDVTTLEITLEDKHINCQLVLSYSIFNNLSCIARSAKFINKGDTSLFIESAMSMSLDLYDKEYEMIQLDGAWSRERHIHTRKLEYGIQSVSSTRGASSSTHNPFIALKRYNTTENSGEVYGFNLLYSGNFLSQVEVDSFDVTRVSIGINPFEFEWVLEKNSTFHTPEAIISYSDMGLNSMSQNFHNLFKKHLMRGKWKNKPRPILINNWEATYFAFNEEAVLSIAKKAKEVGVELFVLDDGWFGKRNNDNTSLGDWYPNLEKLPDGIKGLSEKIHNLGLMFGLWFEPEMVNEISDMYSKHPEWVISVPGRKKTYGRNQYVLDFSNPVVVNAIFEKMDKILSESKIDYIKWDMNRNITEAYSKALPKEKQKEFFHRYILGVYDLYERLINKYPDILFESCASGGARFDAGMLYYAPQGWTSDNTDAVERLKIQTGTSLAYPVVSMGSHVSAVPNHQMNRNTSLKMRGDVAYFGTFGYDLDLNKLLPDEINEVKLQIDFFKKYREVIQYGDFYRISSSGNYYSFMCVSSDKKTAILAYYKILATPNPSLKKIRLKGLDEKYNYYCTERNQYFYGDELMNFGFMCDVEFTGLIQSDNYDGIYSSGTDKGDFTSRIYVF